MMVFGRQLYGVFRTLFLWVMRLRGKCVSRLVDVGANMPEVVAPDISGE